MKRHSYFVSLLDNCSSTALNGFEPKLLIGPTVEKQIGDLWSRSMECEVHRRENRTRVPFQSGFSRFYRTISKRIAFRNAKLNVYRIVRTVLKRTQCSFDQTVCPVAVKTIAIVVCRRSTVVFHDFTYTIHIVRHVYVFLYKSFKRSNPFYRLLFLPFTVASRNTSRLIRPPSIARSLKVLTLDAIARKHEKSMRPFFVRTFFELVLL